MSMEKLVGGVLVGLRTHAGLVLADERCSQYHVGGFARCSQRVLEFATLAALAGRVPNALHEELHRDDRVPMRYNVLTGTMTNEIEYLEKLPMFVYTVIGRIADKPAALFRGEVLFAAHKGSCFFYYRLLSEARGLPLSLCGEDTPAMLRDMK